MEVDSEILRIGSAILGYLESHPEASDTEEHIARWWLAEQQVEPRQDQTGRALAWLDRNGFIERLELPDRRALYRLRRGTVPPRQ
jgi:hypothetical protein